MNLSNASSEGPNELIKWLVTCASLPDIQAEAHSITDRYYSLHLFYRYTNMKGANVFPDTRSATSTELAKLFQMGGMNVRRAWIIGAAFAVLATEFGPSGGAGATTQTAVHDFVVSIDENGGTSLKGRPLNNVLLDFPEAVIPYGKSAKLYLWVDRRVEFGAVAKVLMAAGNVGVKRVSFGVPPGHPVPSLEATGIGGSFKIGSTLPSHRDSDIVLRVDFDGTLRGNNQETLDAQILGNIFRQAGSHNRPIYICPDNLSRWSSTIRLLSSARISNTDITLMSGSC